MTESEDTPLYPPEQCMGWPEKILIALAALIWGLCMASPFIADAIRN